ncbi:alpha/beta hydrolase [Flagellimonas sp.]|uniref:alpha/beta hydrolase n=1 Tax=Flagellimonas sp. TaxID=2058762 RepID=UPI003C7D2C14
MQKSKWSKRIKLIGVVLILSGILSLFLEKSSWIHTASQISFVLGCVLYLMSSSFKNNTTAKNVFVLLSVFSYTVQTFGQDYTSQIQGFEKSFHQKDVTVVMPFLSDSLRFDPLPVTNTIPILTNIVTKLPKLNGLQMQQVEVGKVLVKYDFEKLGSSESIIWFDSAGKIWKIEFVENLVKQQLAQQQKLKSSVQMPMPDQLTFEYSKKTIQFPSNDGLTISGELFEVDRTKPVILLCHQAGYNKFEYADIGPRLNKMGYNALAIDQRSGGTFAGKKNETYERAMKKGSSDIEFTDAIQDIAAAIAFLSHRYNQKIIVWGSSYSAGLVLHEAVQNPNIKAVLSFSPGDYFGDELPSLEHVFPKLKQPFLVTSSKEESAALKQLLKHTPMTKRQLQFIPSMEGFHGSRALWVGQQGADEYWQAVSLFLNEID